MTDGHRGHLSASLFSLEEATRHMAEVGRHGRSPGNGQRLTAIARPEWAAIAAHLRRAERRLTYLVRTLAPERLLERDSAEGLSGTLFRLSILLRNAEEQIVDDLDPSRMEAKFGQLTEDERQILAEATEGLRSDLKQVRDRLEGLRTP